MSTNQVSLARARANIGLAPLILAGVQAVLLYLTTSSPPILNLTYGESLLWRVGAQRFVPLLAALLGIAMFVLPSVIGAVSRSWKSALVLAVVPWWIAVVAHAGTLLAPYIGLASAPGESGGRFDYPFWLSAGRLPLLLASLALFAALGCLGYLARRVGSGE